MASDPYMSSYYGTSFPYQAFGVGDGTWSNGGDPMTFLSGYGGQMGHDSYNIDGMFGGGGFGTFNQPGFNYFHGNGDYSTWGNSMSRKPHYDDYYRDSGVYGSNDDRGVKAVEQGMQGLGLTDGKADSKDLAKQDTVKVSGMDVVEGGAMVPAPKKMTWANIASQPAKPQPQMKKKAGMPPPPMVPGKHNMDIGTWESKNGGGPKPVAPPPAPRPAWGAIRGGRGGPPASYTAPPHQQQQPPAGTGSHHPHHHPPTPLPSHPVLDELRIKNNYNPTEFDMSAKGARFFVIKSYSEDDIHRSTKYEIWCSTEHGNKRLDTAFREREGKGPVYLFFSVNGSGHFCGMAQMTSAVDYHASSSVWSQDKWKGQFRVKWVYVKDVPNVQLRHIRLENNKNKPVTNSRDTQEVPFEKGKQVLKIIHQYRHSTSIFDDFVHYEKRQEEEDQRKAMTTTHVPGLNKVCITFL